MTPTAATPPTPTPQYIVGARAKGSKSASRRIAMLPDQRVAYYNDRNRKVFGNRLDATLGPAQLKIARRWAAARRLELVVRVNDPYPHVKGDRDCNSNLLRALEKTGQILSKQQGRKIVIDIRSGRRKLSEQQALHAQNMRWDGTRWVPKPGRPLTAYPNANAPHILGIAADCGIEGVDIGDFPGAIKALDQAGGCLPVRTEDWHVQLGENFAGASS